MKVFTAEQMRAFDRAAGEQAGLPSIVLMENAALRVAEFLQQRLGPLGRKRVVVLCGKGNNGGDGLAIARHLGIAGCPVSVLLTAERTAFTGDAATNLGALADMCPVQIFEPPASPPDIIIDALLGTGFHGELRDDRLLSALQWMKEQDAVTIAVDIPSGLNSDTGEASPQAVRADYTVTFAGPKRGMFLRAGPELCGEIWVGSIGTPPSLMEDTNTACQCITRDFARQLLPRRALDANKGSAGRVVLCGGSYGMSGAPVLAARAALRAGAGLAIACVPDRILPIFAASCVEATSHPLPCDEAGSLLPEAAGALPGYWKDAQVVALGPGLSRTPGALDFARRVMLECPHPLVIDADALYAVRGAEADVKARGAATIMTPHPGEMGELMQMQVPEVQSDRIGIAQRCAARFNSIVVLKGSRSIIATPDGEVWINLTGNSGMATGGTGDVLTGTISGLLAQLKDAGAATLLGVYLHGLAGDLAYAELGNGLIAGDLAERLPAAVSRIENSSTGQGHLVRLQ